MDSSSATFPSSPPPYRSSLKRTGELVYHRENPVLALKNVGTSTATIIAYGTPIHLQPACVLLVHDIDGPEGDRISLSLTNDFNSNRVVINTPLSCLKRFWKPRANIIVRSGTITTNPRMIWPGRDLYPLLMTPSDSLLVDLLERDRRFNTKNPLYYLPIELRLRIYRYLYYR